MEKTLIDKLSDLGLRFNGLDIECRPSEKKWPSPWRIKTLSTKGERAAFRIEVYGDTLEAATKNILEKIGGL